MGPEENIQPTNEAAAQQTTTDVVEPVQRSFDVDLYQSHWARSHTETFQVEAANIEEAKKKAVELIVSTRDLPEDSTNKWDVVVRDPSETEDQPQAA